MKETRKAFSPPLRSRCLRRIGREMALLGVVEVSSLRIGNAWANNVGLVGGAELGAGGAYGWFVDFEMVEE